MLVPELAQVDPVLALDPDPEQVQEQVQAVDRVVYPAFPDRLLCRGRR